MANETEVERLVVRLVGNNTHLKQTIRDSVTAAKQAEREAAMAERSRARIASQQTVQAERERIQVLHRGRDVTMAVENAQERLTRQTTEYNTLLKSGAITRETYNRAASAAVQQYRDETGVTAKAAQARADWNTQLARGTEMTRAVETATERYNRQTREVEGLARSGAITQETYGRQISQLSNEYKKATQESNQFAQHLQSVGTALTSIGAIATVVGASLAGIFGTIAASSVQASAKFETTKMAFEVLLGSAEEAQKTLDDLVKFAAETPLELPEIEAAARGLITFGETGDEMMSTLRDLGNAAAATGTDFSMVALIFNQIRGVGKLLMQDFRQLSTRGILSMQDLADHFGVTLEEAQKMMSAGQIGFEDVRQIFAKLSGEGGRFQDFMQRTSKTTEGVFSILRDSFNVLKRLIGDELVPAAKEVAKWITSVADSFKELNPGLKTTIAYSIGIAAATGVLLTAFGATALLVGTVISSYAALTGVMAGLTGATNAYTISAIASKTAIMAFYAASVVLAGFVIYKVSTAIYNASQAVKDYNKALEESAKLQSEVTGRFSEGTAGIISRAQGMGGESREKFLEEELARAQKEAEGYSASVKGAQANVDSLNTTWKSFTGNKVLEAAEVELGQTKEMLDQAKARVKAIQEEMKNVAAPEVMDEVTEEQKKAREEADKFAESLNHQIETFGMSGRAADIYALKISEAEKEILRADVALIEAKEAQQKVIDGSRDLTESLMMQVQTFGMTSAEASLYKLQMDGATEAQLKNARAAAAQLKGLEEQKKLMDQGKELMKQYRTPMEVLTDRQNELQNMLTEGAITFDVYTKAMKDAEDQAHKDYTADLKVTGVEGVEAGTAEALARLQEYRAGTVARPSMGGGLGGIEELVAIGQGAMNRAGIPGAVGGGPAGGFPIAGLPVNGPGGGPLVPVNGGAGAAGGVAGDPTMLRIATAVEALLALEQEKAGQPIVELRGAGLGVGG